jgi:hypothetical protein
MSCTTQPQGHGLVWIFEELIQEAFVGLPARCICDLGRSGTAVHARARIAACAAAWTGASKALT